jgi:hypothetical protein
LYIYNTKIDKQLVTVQPSLDIDKTRAAMFPWMSRSHLIALRSGT